MKKQIKKCKGFENSRCENCKRQDDNATETLVKELIMVKTYIVCEHYIFTKNKPVK